MKKGPSVLVIFLTVFIDLIGFGIVVPLIALYSKSFGASGLLIGIIGASFSAAQFVFAPIWGRMSDRMGRRPILLMSTAGAALSYVLFAIGSGLANSTAALTILLISRTFAGACGGNITVAQAYIADITPPENRSKRMGLIGMAFGLGFICGPIIGGLGLKYFGHAGPGWLAAGICAANFLLAFFILAESRTPSSEHAKERPRFQQWGHTLAQPKIGLLILIFFLATFAFSCFEITLPLLINDNFHLGISNIDEIRGATTIVYLFVFCGFIGAFVQGGATGRLVKMLGEPKLIALSLVMTGVSLALLPMVKGNGQLFWSHLFHSDNGPWGGDAAGSGAAGGGFEPDAAAGVWGVVKFERRTRARIDDRDCAKRRQPGADSGAAVRGATLHADSSAAVFDLRGISVLAGVIAVAYLPSPGPARFDRRSERCTMSGRLPQHRTLARFGCGRMSLLTNLRNARARRPCH